MRSLFVLALYLAPFIVIGIAARRWMDRKGTGLTDVQAEGDPQRRRSRFLLGIWRHNDRE